MGKYIYINYAYEDRKQVMEILDSLTASGVQYFSGNGSEEKVAGSSFVLNLYSKAAATSKTYKKILNFAFKNEIDSVSIHIDENGIGSDVETQLDLMLALFKMKYQGIASQKDAADQKVKAVTEVQEAKAEVKTDKPEKTLQKIDIEVQTKTRDGQKKEAEKTETEEKPVKAADSEKKESVKKETEERPVKAAQAEKLTVPTLTDREKLYEEGMAYLNGDSVMQDIPEGFELIRRAANQGHTEAQYQLSICYDQGLGVRRNITEAAKWCQMAAYGGHAKAQSEIGYCYEYGQGVVRNSKEAVRWYQAASEQGNLQAKNNLAFCYQKGKGVQKNLDKAIELYEEAAAMGDASAQYNLGFCFWYGEGVAIDKARALELFEASSSNGNAKAGQMLKILSSRRF